MNNQKINFIQALAKMNDKQKLNYFKHQRRNSKNKLGWDLIIASELIMQRFKRKTKM